MKRSTILSPALLAGLLAAGLTTAARAAAPRTYSTTAEATAAVQSAQARLDGAVRALERIHDRARKNDDDHWKLFQELVALDRERERVLRELLDGRFCSKCKRSATEIERADRKPFEQHLDTVKGTSEPAPRELFEAKLREFKVKIDRVREQMARLEAERDNLQSEAHRAYAAQEEARLELHTAHLWVGYLRAVEGWQRTGELTPPGIAPVPGMPGTLFGLGARAQLSEYGAYRLYWKKGGGVETVPPYGPLRPGSQVEKAGYHRGIDYGSGGKPVPFTAGVYGTATVVPGSAWNTIVVRLEKDGKPTGFRLEYLHASRVLVKTGDRVTPSIRLGITGGKGPKGPTQFGIHLHVQAKDAAGRPVDPRIAVLDPQDVRSRLAREASRRAEAERAPVPTLTWRPKTLFTEKEVPYSVAPRRGSGEFIPLD